MTTSEKAIATAVADVLSPSSINTLQKCEVQFMFSYFEEIKIPPDSSLFFGSRGSPMGGRQ